jgi:tRNA-specific 2-thiouridylase
LKVKGISLFSGGLDSILAVKVIQDQGIEVDCISFETPFFSADKARDAAAQIECPLVVLDITEEHLRMLRAPRYGYGKHMNPCIDCHALMLSVAGRRMEETGADFLFTGEVLGQRPMSQTKQSLHIVGKISGYQGYIVRPLSARLLPETIPEQEGKVDRERLLDIQGRSRKRQLELVEFYGIKEYSNPAGGCLLTDPMFSKRLKDLFEYRDDFAIRDLKLLKIGRRIRLNHTTEINVGRNKGENAALQRLVEKDDIIIHMRDYPGPTVMIPYGCDAETLESAAAICALYGDAPSDVESIVVCHAGDATTMITTAAAERDAVKKMII